MALGNKEVSIGFWRWLALDEARDRGCGVAVAQASSDCDSGGIFHCTFVHHNQHAPKDVSSPKGAFVALASSKIAISGKSLRLLIIKCKLLVFFAENRRQNR